MNEETRQAFVEAGEFIGEHEHSAYLNGIATLLASENRRYTVETASERMARVLLTARRDIADINRRVLEKRDIARRDDI